MAGNGQPICSCPDKWSLQPDGHNCVKNAGSDCEAETTDLTQLLHNNLKGFGPDEGVPESMVFGDFLTLEDGTLVNLEVTAEDGYTPLKVRYNGVAPGGEFGQIGIKTGSDVSLIFKLLNKKTGKKIDKLPKIAITWYDLGKRLCIFVVLVLSYEVLEKLQSIFIARNLGYVLIRL
jgi:hypothetical protein